MRATGHTGRFQHSYQVAAILTGWQCEPMVGSKGHRFHVSAKVKKVVEPWISRRPLDLILEFGSSKWIWHNVNPKFTDASIDLELTRTPTIERGKHD
jgi:hypothetical protein